MSATTTLPAAPVMTDRLNREFCGVRSLVEKLMPLLLVSAGVALTAKGIATAVSLALVDYGNAVDETAAGIAYELAPGIIDAMVTDAAFADEAKQYWATVQK